MTIKESETQLRTRERVGKRNAKFSPRGKRRSVLSVPIGRGSLRLFLGPLATTIAARIPTAPANLSDMVGRLDPIELATITLNGILPGIFWGYDGIPDSKRPVYQSVGRYLKDRLEFAEINIAKAIAKQIPRGRPRAEDFLREEWGTSEYVLAGWWLTEAAVQSGYFGWRGHRLEITDRYKDQFDKLYNELLWAEPYFMPHLSPPPDWTGWRKHYDGRICATIVRGWRNDQRTEIGSRFVESFDHAKALNRRGRVGLRINKDLLPVVGRFAAECMGHTGWKRRNDEATLSGDLRDAAWIGDRTFYLDHACDERGRMYALHRFSYDREDHVRALIEFDRGVYCGAYGIQWLEFNAANLYGAVDKESWGRRSRWTGEHRHLIREIAKDPASTFDKWSKADKPLQFIRACFELVEAWDNPGFETRLPVGIDATASGLQHLALLGRDRETMAKVNLTLVHDGALDIYGTFAGHIESLLRQDGHPWAAWWLDRLVELGNKRRKLFKGPVGTFNYSSTEPSWNEQIRESYAKLHQQGKVTLAIPRDDNGDLIKLNKKSAVGYLVDLVGVACSEMFPGPYRVMEWLKQQVSLSNSFVSWDGPSQFPCRNLAEPPNEWSMRLPDGKQIVLSDGTKPLWDWTEKDRDWVSKEMLKGIAANFVHSLDAAHAARTINAWDRDIITCHDCFYGHAPHMYELQKTVLVELQRMYQEHDPLHELWVRNGHNGKLPPRFMDDKEYYERLGTIPCCDYAFS